MDYKYIEQLLDRYWTAETTLEEERILKAFFSQKEVPTHLQQWSLLFVGEQLQEKVQLSADFEERLLKKIKAKEISEEDITVKVKTKPTVQAVRPTFIQRLRPLYNAAATIALFLLVGSAVQHGFQSSNSKGWRIGAEPTIDNPIADADSIRESLKTLRNVGNSVPTATAKDSTAPNISTTLVAPIE